MKADIAPAPAGLLSARSLVGGVAVGLILLAFGVGLPWLARALPGDDGFRAGVPYPVSTQVFLTPASGWTRDARRSDLGVTLTMVKGSAEVTVYTRQGGLDDVSDELDELRATHARDGYQLGEPEAVRTPTGLTGASVRGTSAATELHAWVLSDDAQLISLVGTWPREQPEVAAEVQAMVSTVEVR